MELTTVTGKVMKKIGCSGCVIIILLVLAALSLAAQYTKEDDVTATVHSVTVQQNVSGGAEGSVTTTYSYIVSTDLGTMQIKPDGIFASHVFGRLKEGKTYRLHTRGFSAPVLGVYPYIIDAKESCHE